MMLLSWSVSFNPWRFTTTVVSPVIKRMVSAGVDRFVAIVEAKANDGGEVR